eukprot:jgi/Picsp_1/1634/NSC_05109-R1_---NA---
MTSASATENAQSGGTQGEANAGLLGKLFGGGGGKKVQKAKLGLELQMYYHEELKCWVAPGEEEQKKKEIEGTMAPPPMVSTSIENRDQQDGAPAAMPPMGVGLAPMSRTGVTSRYAAMPNLGTAPASGPSGSIFAGLKPPPLGNSEFGQPRFSGSAIAFKPNVFKPSTEESRDTGYDNINKGALVEGDKDTFVGAEADLTTDEAIANLAWSQDATATQTNETANVANNNNNLDPRMLEVLSFWSVYREQGYSVEIMKEWVVDNYDEDLSGLDFDHMLADQSIALQVSRYIEENKQNTEVSSQTEETMAEQVHAWPSQIRPAEEVHQGPEAPYEALHESQHETSTYAAGVFSDQVVGGDSKEHAVDPSFGVSPPHGQSSQVITDGYSEYQFEGPNSSEIPAESEYATYHYDLSDQRDNPLELSRAQEDYGAVNHHDDSSNSAYWNSEPQAMESYHQDDQRAKFEQSTWNTTGTYQQTAEGFGAPHGNEEYPTEAEKEYLEVPEHGDRPLSMQFPAYQVQNEVKQGAGSIGSLSSEEETDVHQAEGVSAKMDKQPQEYGLNPTRLLPPFDASNDSITGMGSFEDSQQFMGASAPLIQGESKTDSEAMTEFTEAQPTMMWVPSGIINAAEEGNQHQDPPRPDDTVLSTRGALEEIVILKSKLEEANNLVAEKSNAVEEIRNSLNEIIEQKNSQISGLEENLDDVKAELSTVQAEYKGISVAAHEKEKALNEDIDAASTKILSLEERIALLESQVKEEEEKRMSEGSQIAEKEASLRHELDQALEKITNLEFATENEAILRGKVDVLTREKEELNHNFDKLLEEKQISEQNLREELSEKLERLQEEKHNVEHSLREEIASIKAKAEEEYQASPFDHYFMHESFVWWLFFPIISFVIVQAAIDERDAEIMQLEARTMLAETHAELAAQKVREDLEVEIRTSLQEEKVELEAVLEAKEAELRELQEQLQIKLEVESLLEQKEDELKQLENNAQDSEKKLALAKRKIQAQHSQIEKLSATIEELHEQGAEISEINLKMEHLEQENRTLRHEVSQKEIQISSLQESESAVESLQEENSRLLDLLGEKQDHMEMLNEELSELRARAEESFVLQEEMSRWEETASVAQEALMKEKSEREMAEARLLELDQRMSAVVEALDVAQSQLVDMQTLQKELNEQHARAEALSVDCEGYQCRLEEANSLIESAQAEIEELTRVLHETEASANSEELQAEINLLRSQLAAISEGASQKDDEMRKYKLQLVKAKKLRAADQEKIEELKELQEEFEAKLAAAMEALAEESQKKISTDGGADYDEACAAREEVEEGLNEALTALGQEEAKVHRLVELLSIAGLSKDEIELELAQVEEKVGYGLEEEDDQNLT